MLSFYVLDNVCYNCLIKKGCWTQLGALWWLISVWAQINSVGTLTLQAMIFVYQMQRQKPLMTQSQCQCNFFAPRPHQERAEDEMINGAAQKPGDFTQIRVTYSGTLARALRVVAWHRVVALPSQLSHHNSPLTIPAHGSPFTVPPPPQLPLPCPLTPFRAAVPWFLSMQLSCEGRGLALRVSQHQGKHFTPVAFPSCPTGAPDSAPCPALPWRWEPECLCTTAAHSEGELFFFSAVYFLICFIKHQTCFLQLAECFPSAGYLC